MVEYLPEGKTKSTSEACVRRELGGIGVEEGVYYVERAGEKGDWLWGGDNL